jgi:hypothetical protein
MKTPGFTQNLNWRVIAATAVLRIRAGFFLPNCFVLQSTFKNQIQQA